MFYQPIEYPKKKTIYVNLTYLNLHSISHIPMLLPNRKVRYYLPLIKHSHTIRVKMGSIGPWPQKNGQQFWTVTELGLFTYETSNGLTRNEPLAEHLEAVAASAGVAQTENRTARARHQDCLVMATQSAKKGGVIFGPIGRQHSERSMKKYSIDTKHIIF